MKALTIAKPYADPILEQEFQAFESLLLVYAKHHAQSDAMSNLPACVSDYQHLIGNYLHSETEQFIHSAAGKLQTLSGMAGAKELEGAAANQTAPLHARLTDCDIAIAHTAAQCRRQEPDRAEKVKYVFVQICLGIMSASEGLMGYQPLRYLRLPRYPAGIGALGIALGIYLICEHTARWIRKAKTAQESLLRYGAVLIPAAAGFFELARLRMNGYSQAAVGFSDAQPVHQPACAAISIFTISTLLFTIGLVTAVKTCRSAEQVRQRDAYRKARKELKTLQATRASVAAEIADTEQRIASNTLESRQRHEYAAGFYERVIACANKAKQVYITTNIRSRGGAPLPFFNEIPAMRFNLFAHAQNRKQ